MTRNGADSTYDRVPQDEEDTVSDATSTTTPQENTFLKQDGGSISRPMESLEVDLEGLPPLEEEDRTQLLFQWAEPPWILSVGITLILITPTLLWAIFFTRNLIGRMWPSALFALHLTLALWTAIRLIPSSYIERSTGITRQRRRRRTLQRFVPALLDIVFFGSLYVGICNTLIYFFFTEIDGTPVIEYSDRRRQLAWIRRLGLLVAALRLTMEVISFGLVCYYRRYGHWRSVASLWQIDEHAPVLPRMCATALAWYQQQQDYWALPTRRMQICLRWLLFGLFGFSVVLLIWCLDSIVVHWIAWPAPSQTGPHCDALDTTECFLPFPSFHHMIPDTTSVTGWRVNLRPNVLPPLKGRLTMEPSFLNELDGFSTMAPLLFYMEGLKEANEKQHQQQHRGRMTARNTTPIAISTESTRLQGANTIDMSTTPASITLLLNVQERKLVPHTAEIDYLDPQRPLVLVFPAQPLSHNTHYALAVVQATDAQGKRLPPTPGMQDLWMNTTTTSDTDVERLARYNTVLIPALQEAAPWLDLNDPGTLQLLFDYHTISAESQLGPVRAVRDGTLSMLDSPEWGDWKDHVRVIRRQDSSCSRVNATVARTIHGELDVPWFLEAFGPGHRGAFLSARAVATGRPVLMGKARFVVHIPCSLRAAAIRAANGTELKAVMEFGHGLFYNRDEASDGFLLKMANDNGYIITAMDWRGMSSYDLLVVAETLMSKPRQFRAIRDNLIQGYANKLALQHFSRNGMLDLPWFEFKSGFNKPHRVPFFQGQPPSFVFYGISQGGILGAGYSALAGPTKLIDRSILGSPGTPFALIMSRSLDFQGYDVILLLNFYNNRHVRALLCLTQMAWDSVEGSGLLAPPVTEPYPPILIQAGLGDAIVTTIASEALARGFGASILSSNPRNIYGVPMVVLAAEEEEDPSSKQKQQVETPHVVLTELLYEKEYQSLPLDDEFADWNAVHFCVRKDPHLIAQVAEFINTGRIADACAVDGCLRHNVTCGEAY